MVILKRYPVVPFLLACIQTLSALFPPYLHRVMFHDTFRFHRTLYAICLIALSTWWLHGCGGAQRAADLALDLPSLVDQSQDQDAATIEVTQDGRLVVQNATKAIQNASYFAIVPPQWDDSLGDVPALGTGLLVHTKDQSFVLVAAIEPRVSIKGAHIVAADHLVPLSTSKAVATIQVDDAKGAHTPQTGDTVQLSVGRNDNVAQGDLYFVLTTDKLDHKQPRLGDLIGAIITPKNIEKHTSTATIIHASGELKAGQTAVFAQKIATQPASTMNIMVAPFSKEQNGTNDADSKAMLDAVADISQTYQIANVSVGTIPSFINPRPWDAPYHAEDATADSGWGVAVFGDKEDAHTFIYNAVGYGNVPSPSGWVGILPGGMPLPYQDSVAELAPQLALSFLANGLGMRGNHAQAIYMLEAALRSDNIDARMRYHLHEHLALRYAAIGHIDEAMRIMHYDLINAQRDDDIYAQLNAYSIRSYLDNEWGLNTQMIQDENRFLELADGVLPDFGLDGEKLGLARGLLLDGDLKKAEQLTIEIATKAKERGDYRVHMHAISMLTRIQLQNDELAAALLVFDALEDEMDNYQTETQVALRLEQAQLLTQAGDVHEALEMLFQTFDRLDEISPAGKANALQRAANIMLAIEQPIQANLAIMEAAKIYEELGLEQEAANLWTAGANLSLSIVPTMPPQQGVQILKKVREELQHASNIFRALGDEGQAAACLFFIAAIDANLNDTGADEPLFDTIRDMHLKLADFRSLAQLAEYRAQMAHFGGDTSKEKAFKDEAQKWIRIGKLDSKDIPADSPADAETPNEPSPIQEELDEPDTL